MGVERQGRFRELLASNEEYSDRGRAFIDGVREWPAVARAMTTLALPLHPHGASPGALRWPNPHCPLRSPYHARASLPFKPVMQSHLEHLECSR